jgi:hypothetical protein
VSECLECFSCETTLNRTITYMVFGKCKFGISTFLLKGKPSDGPPHTRTCRRRPVCLIREIAQRFFCVPKSLHVYFPVRVHLFGECGTANLSGLGGRLLTFSEQWIRVGGFEIYFLCKYVYAQALKNGPFCVGHQNQIN